MAASKQSMGRLLVIRSLKLRMRRVVIVLAALTMGAAIITAMAGVYFDINEKMSHELRSYGANFFVGPKEDQGTLSTTDYQHIVALLPEADRVASSPYLYGLVQTDLEQVVAMGVDFGQMKKLAPFWQVLGERVGVSFDERNVMIGSKLAQRLELKVGAKINLLQGNKRHTFTIKGIVNSGGDEDNYLIVNLSFLQKWLHQSDQAHYALFSIDNNMGQVSTIAQQLKKQFPNLVSRPILKVSASEGKVLDKIKLLMGVVALVILVLSILCVNTTLTAMMSERRREFALQIALGAPRKQIMSQIMQETLLMAGISIVLGLALGYVLAQILGHTVFSASINIRLPVFVLTVLLSVSAALLAAYIPAVRAMKVDPAKVLKGE
ncbi:ABC transporter permease [Sansalvadorimonas verongulae]|uniref:ABC transporter permease n=1 Tax=Sansalvadorimonas verongulae TaxID=2172824 RepID=UPI0012BB6ABE|nr:FtsX-like permease family protein [Sansalvadorimonas verongulae]MTI15403.1 ABC transporter permease [Sansalvadorimonas verongulae]